MVGSAAGGLYLLFHESVADVVASTPDVKVAAKRLDVALPGQPATALVVGYDQRAGEGEGRPVPLRHGHARPRRPRHEVDLDDVVPARPLRPDPLSRSVAVRRPHQQRLLDLRDEGHARDGAQADRPPDQLPDHRQLPRLPPARRRDRRDLARRRPPLLQRPRRRLRLRDDQPLPRLPEARRLPGARLRPLPPHRQRSLPGRPAAALRARLQGSDQVEHRARSTCRR